MPRVSCGVISTVGRGADVGDRGADPFPKRGLFMAAVGPWDRSLAIFKLLISFQLSNSSSKRSISCQISLMASDRLALVEEFRSKVTAAQMRALHSKFDIPRGYKLTAPAMSAAVFHHSEGRSPLYLAHLECGLRLPLHPALRKIFEALGVSPMQMTPNSIAMLVGFTVICSWLGVDPSVSVLSHLMSVSASKAAHFHLQSAGDFKVVLDLPSSHKGWKERFIWVEGDDSNLSCSGWPEINREALDAKSLTSAERMALEQIVSYTGPRKMAALLDKSVLRWHGISSVPPTSRDEVRATSLALGDATGSASVPEPARSEGSSERSSAGLERRSAKRPRVEAEEEGAPAARELAEAAGKSTAEIAGGLVRTKRKKVTHGPRGTRRPGDAVGACEGSESTGAADLEGELPLSPGARVSGVPESVQRQAGARADSEAASRGVRPSRRPGKEPVGGGAQIPELAEWPSYSLDESNFAAWEAAKELMIGKLPPGREQDTNPSYADRFIPPHVLSADSSVLESRFVQARAVEQFCLPRDEDLLKTVPDVGLHVILRSYLTRGCLVEKELFRRMAEGRRAYNVLRRIRATGAETNSVEFDQLMAELSATQAELADWRREVEVKDRSLADLKAEIYQLKQKNQKGGKGIESSGSAEGALHELDVVRTQLAMERQISECARSKLVEEQTAHEKLLKRHAQLEEDLRVATEEVARLKSPGYEVEVLERKRSDIVEEYRHGIMGKTEVALACKAGSDYILAQLTPEQRGAAGRLRYPPAIADSVEVLADIERAGGGFPVEDDMGEEGEESASGGSTSSSEGVDVSGSARGGEGPSL